MKIVPTHIHSFFDYVVGFALMLAPAILGFADLGGAVAHLPQMLGLLVIVQGLITQYEGGIVKALPLKIHLLNDGIAGGFLMASPWLFGFSRLAGDLWILHFTAGLVMVLFALTTEGERRTTGIKPLSEVR